MHRVGRRAGPAARAVPLGPLPPPFPPVFGPAAARPTDRPTTATLRMNFFMTLSARRLFESSPFARLYSAERGIRRSVTAGPVIVSGGRLREPLFSLSPRFGGRGVGVRRVMARRVGRQRPDPASPNPPHPYPLPPLRGERGGVGHRRPPESATAPVTPGPAVLGKPLPPAPTIPGVAAPAGTKARGWPRPTCSSRPATSLVGSPSQYRSRSASRCSSGKVTSTSCNRRCRSLRTTAWVGVVRLAASRATRSWLPRRRGRCPGPPGRRPACRPRSAGGRPRCTARPGGTAS